MQKAEEGKPLRLGFFVFNNKSLRKVNVIVYMVLAETVIPGAAGAITELKLRIRDVCPAADGAFVLIRLTAPLILRPLDGCAEVYRLL